MIKEWLLGQILRNKIVLFENEEEYIVINNIYFGEGVVVCKNTDWKESDFR